MKMVALKSLTGSVLLDTAVVLAILYLGWSIRSYWRLRHVPGPTLWAWTVFPLFRLHLSGRQYEGLGEITQKYGKIVRIAPKTILIWDPDVLRKMSAVRSPYTRADWYGAFRLAPGKDNVFSQRNEKIHEDMRRMMAAGYSGKETPTLEPDIDECVSELIQLIENKYISTGPDRVLDLSQKIQFFTLDVMTKVAFDYKFHDLRDDRDNFGYAEEAFKTFKNIYGVVTIPSLVDFLTNTGVMELFSPSIHSEFGLGKVFAITRAQVGARFDDQGKPKGETKRDIMASFIKNGISKDQAEQESLTQLTAGSDTTASALRMTLLCVMANPRVCAKLVSEFDAARASGKVTSSKESGGVVSNEEARELPYLQACIREAIRWFPPIASMVPKRTPPGGDEILGYKIPGNISVANCAWALHKNPELFGPDEDVFRPERWILTSDGGDEPSTDKIKTMERNNDLIFGSGKYQCLGKNIAAMELNKVIFELFDRFQFTLVNPTKGVTSFCAGVWLQNDFFVSIRKRS